MTWTIIISDDARAVYTLIGHHAGPGAIFKVQHTHTLKLKNIALVYIYMMAGAVINTILSLPLKKLSGYTCSR